MHDNEEHRMSAHGAASSAREGLPEGRRSRPISGGIGVLFVAAALGFAACGGGTGDPPHVASLGTNASQRKGTPTSTQQIGNPTRLLDEWATCIRSHGDPNQVDPTIDTNKDIEITMRNVSPTLSSAVHGSTGPCSTYLLSAEAALRGGQAAPQAPSIAQEIAYVDCMRTNGVPNYPDPSADGDTKFEGTGINTDSTTFENADELCSKRTGTHYYAPGTEAPGVVIVRSINEPAGAGNLPANGPGANSGSESAEISLPNG